MKSARIAPASEDLHSSISDSSSVEDDFDDQASRRSSFEDAMKRIALLEAKDAEMDTTRVRRNSAIECQRCLEPGVERDCCGHYYCNFCFYKFENCPSCETAIIGPNTETDVTHEANDFQIAVSFTCKVLVFLIPIICAGLYIYNEVTKPETIMGMFCDGIQPSCGGQLCRNMDYFLNAEKFDFEYEDSCRTNRTSTSRVGCVCSSYCTIDDRIQKFTDDLHGHDFCSTDFSEGYIIADEHFYPGFPTDIWDTMANGAISSDCDGTSGTYSLRFRGMTDRWVITLPFSVPNGGELEFWFRYGTGGSCRNVYSGVVYLAYSLDDGSTWTDITDLDIGIYKHTYFTQVLVPIPEEAWSTSTKFKWYQNDYTKNFDYWAIDDFVVRRYFAAGWLDDTPFRNLKESFVHEHDTVARGCFECDVCRGHQSDEDCDGLREYMEPDRYIKAREFIIILITGISALKVVFLIWNRVRRYFRAILRVARRRSATFQAKTRKAIDKVPATTFKARRSLRWRLFFLLWGVAPVVLIILACLAFGDMRGDVTIKPDRWFIFNIDIEVDIAVSWLFFACIIMDSANVAHILINVVGFTPKFLFGPSVGVYNHIDQSVGWVEALESNCYVVNGSDEKAVSLNRIQKIILEHQPVLRRFCVFAILGCFPWGTFLVWVCQPVLIGVFAFGFITRQLFGIDYHFKWMEFIHWACRRHPDDKMEFDACLVSKRAVRICKWSFIAGFITMVLYCASAGLPIMVPEEMLYYWKNALVTIYGGWLIVAFLHGITIMLPCSLNIIASDYYGRVLLVKYQSGVTPSKWGSFVSKMGFPHQMPRYDSKFEDLFCPVTMLAIPLSDKDAKDMRDMLRLSSLYNEFTNDDQIMQDDGFDSIIEAEEDEKKRKRREKMERIKKRKQKKNKKKKLEDKYDLEDPHDPNEDDSDNNNNDNENNSDNNNNSDDNDENTTQNPIEPESAKTAMTITARKSFRVDSDPNILENLPKGPSAAGGNRRAVRRKSIVEGKQEFKFAWQADQDQIKRVKENRSNRAKKG